MKVVLEYSLFGDTIAKQLKSKKVVFDKFKVLLFHEQSFQALSLEFHGLISKRQKQIIIEKIHLRLEDHLTKISNEIDFTKNIKK